MNNPNTTLKAGSLNFEHAGWRYYNIIRKKAMEQKFSMSGLVVSLSIAFFIVVATAYSLSLMYKSFSTVSASENQVYHLEAKDYLQSDLLVGRMSVINVKV